MNSKSFVHLHTHTHYSLLKSSCTVSGLVDKCVEYSQPALAVTDYGNMFGAFDLYFSAREKGIKPLLGLEIYLSNHSLPERPSQRNFTVPTVVLLAQNIEGYRNLCQINTIAYLKKFYYVPRVDYDVLKKYQSSILALTGGLCGVVAQTYLKKGPENALQTIRYLKEIYSDRLYLQLNRNGLKEWEAINKFLIEASRITHTPLVVGADVHYMNQKDHVVQDVLMCINTNRTLSDLERFKLKSDQFYFKNSQQMRELFKDLPEACDTTLEVSERCHVHFHLKKEGRPVYHLPRLPLEEGVKASQKLKDLSRKGLEQRFLEIKTRQKSPEIASSVRNHYQERLDQELKIIIDMGFTGYFLIVYDFVHWARKQKIPVGPGRGSGASSLVAYCLRITDLDPMPHHLLFERFLNPERISLPDFDVDFCQEHRNRVIEYVSNKYGKDYVAQVITYGRLQARAAVRDVGRVLGMSYADVDQVAKLIPDRVGITLKEAIEDNVRLKEFMEADPQVDNLIQLARRIEGLIRHVSIHAAGVIIADHPIRSYAPLYRGTEGENVIQCDLNHSKKIGLVKFDFLGLKTLTQINGACQLIEKKNKEPFNIQNISLEDSGIYRVMRKGDTKGVFQFEGEGITNLIVKARPSRFEDIVAINALFRPGPMNMIPSYLDRKKGKVHVEHLFSELEPILKETYGIIVYQEQVLLIASKIAGYTYAEADILRRAMGEKKPSVMKKQKNRFLFGAKKNKHHLGKAEKLFDLMAEFANYGFNKSHAVAYCVLAAQTAWIKCYYPVEFFASLLTTEINNTDKMVHYVKDARKHQIKILPPHVNHSELSFTTQEDKIYFSLVAIKGMGRLAVDHIVSVRGKGFSSVQDFFEKIDTSKINKKNIEALAKAGALDNLGMNRKEILLNYEHLLEQVEQKKTERMTGQINLFGEENLKTESVFFRLCEDWSYWEKLEHEKLVIGFYLSGHPMDRIDSHRSTYRCVPISSLRSRAINQRSVRVWGIISGLREIKTRKGQLMAFARLEDNTDTVDMVIFSDIYLKFRQNISFQQPLLVVGNIKSDSNSSIRIIVQEWHFISITENTLPNSDNIQSKQYSVHQKSENYNV